MHDSPRPPGRVQGVSDRYGECSARSRAEPAEPGAREQAEALGRLRDLTAEGPLTLRTVARDLAHSHARVLAGALGGGIAGTPATRG